MKDYILRIIASAILCALVKGFTERHTAINTIIKSICGVFLTLSILSPVVSFKYSAVSDYLNMYSLDADAVVTAGTSLTNASLHSSIKQQTESYILDKAASLNTALSVEVTLSDDEMPIPCGVCIEGSISPYAKSKLMKLIADDLGIPKEKQTWK